MRALARFSVHNPVLVSIIMLAMIIGGVYSSLTLVREMFPESRPNVVLVSAPYPGATPAEVEQGLALRIEEAVKDVENVDKISTNITEGACSVSIELSNAVDDIDQAVDDVKAAIDTIPRDELPEDAEEIRVIRVRPRLPVIAVTLYGDVDEPSLKAMGERLRDDLLRLPEISDIDLGGTRKAEISVRVQPEKLVEYHLSLSQVTDAISRANLDVPGGQVSTTDQNVAVRTLGETDDANRIADTIVRTSSSGRIVRVRNLGRVVDGFADSDRGGRFNGKSAVSCTVYKTADQDAIRIAELVKAFAAGKRGAPREMTRTERLKSLLGIKSEYQLVYERAQRDPYPANLTVSIHSNLARFIEGRLDLLQRNGLWGLALVFLSLLAFLNVRVAFWVLMGLVVSMCGALMLMQAVGATLNLISMFGLIVVLGLIVDDAIVVGENVYARIERGEDPRSAAIKGTQEVTWPVIVAVATTIGAFLPLMFIEGQIGDFMGILPVVVICALSVSLIEALSILPAHLAEWVRPVHRDQERTLPRSRLGRLARGIRATEQHFVLDIVGAWYKRLLELSVRYRYVTVAVIIAVLMLVIGLTPVGGGFIPFVFVQKMDSETLLADLDMPIGTPIDRTSEAMSVVEQACIAIPEVSTVWAVFGEQIDADESGAYSNVRSHLAQLIVELKTVESRDRSSEEILSEIRRETANIPGVNSLRFRSMQGGPAGPGIEIEITGPQLDDLIAASDVIKKKLTDYSGVFDLVDDYDEGRRELQIELLESARPLGLTTRALATEIRGAFYGLEARTLQRGREDVDIRVRFPESRRRHVYELENMRIATPSGRMVPFSEVARISETRGASAIRRVNQRRAISVSADVDQARGNADMILADLGDTIRELETRFPGLHIEFAGNKREFAKSFASLKRDFTIAMIVIYFMLAGLFKSYLQPLIVMVAVPFGINGAILGHLVMGYPMTLLSMIGLVALTGIVVNDSLIMVDFINKERIEGIPLHEAVIAGGVRRLRPILLTSATTILGLAPLMLETSFQAKFLIPLAISISFGLGFATILTLVLVPANYVILEDFRRIARRIWHGPPQPATNP